MALSYRYRLEHIKLQPTGALTKHDLWTHNTKAVTKQTVQKRDSKEAKAMECTTIDTWLWVVTLHRGEPSTGHW